MVIVQLLEHLCFQCGRLLKRYLGERSADKRDRGQVQGSVLGGPLSAGSCSSQTQLVAVRSHTKLEVRSRSPRSIDWGVLNLQRICKKVLPGTGQWKDSIDYRNVDQWVTRQITRCTSWATKAILFSVDCSSHAIISLCFFCIALFWSVDLTRICMPQSLMKDIISI